MWTARVAIVVLASCRRAPPPPPAPPAIAIVDASTAIADASTPTAIADAAVDPDLPIKEVITRWNDAINARDFAALGALHGSDVRFYGVRVDNATYVARMKAALAKDPAFHQDIDSLRVERRTPDEAKVWFRKKDNKAEHAAYLVVWRTTAGDWVISQESDFATDVNVKCLKSADTLTLTGKIDVGSIIWHDVVSSITVLTLSPAVCVERTGDDDWGGLDRMDGVESIMIDASEPTLPHGTKVRVRGSHLAPHIGSGSYSAPLIMMNVDSTTQLP